MGVAITAYKMRGSADRDAANMIKQLIVNATATETVVKMEGNTPSTSTVTREDDCATLLYHIAKHFIGEPKLFQDRSLQILNILSYPNLEKFIHYKHAFLSKNASSVVYPPLFADNVRTKIQDRNNGNIPYGNLTYGDLVSTINIVALELCTDIKLKHQLKKEQSSSRKELGSFCRDFGFITPPDKIQKDKKEKSHSASDEYSDDEDIDLDYDSDASQSGKDCTCT
ncbi:hypothetical protein H5410_058804 [Solanum commersonii]|uniref:Uncharacterized protein n=1 Tax=Solanum commersonii TaxID=4109 RepID=A0A9J5WUP4_SOLCO|nr:hypothetical protein H5410_058804 [Solanum commersonii]